MMTRIKQFIAISLVFVLALAAIPTKASAANASAGILTVFSTDAHSWISFLNTSATNIKIGAYTVKPMEEITIGRWGEGPSKSSSTQQAHHGIWYNIESEKINLENDMNGRVSYSLGISMTDVHELTKVIEENDNYNIYIGEHCSEFVHTAWSRVDPTIDGPFGYSTPSGLMGVIKTKPGFETNRGVQYPRLIMYKDGSNSTSNSPSLKDVSSRYIGKTIALKSLEANQYVSSNTDRDVAGINATANRSTASTWEYFDVIAGDCGAVGFKAHGNGNYLSTRIDQNKNSAYIQAAYGQNYPKPQSWESFRIFEKDGVQYIQSQSNGKWMQAAVNEADTPLKAAGAHASTWERFIIEPVTPSSGGNPGGSGGNTGGAGGGGGTTRVSQYYHGSDYNEGWYVGEWSNGRPNGYGKLTYDDFGDGKYYAFSFSDGSECKAIYYEGQFSNGWRYGNGTLVYEDDWKQNGTFYGEWSAGKVVFEGTLWHGNRSCPVTQTAKSSVSAEFISRGEWTTQSFTLDVNGRLDSIDTGNLDDYGTFDVYINGSKIANDVSDYCASHPSGTTYKITDIKPKQEKAYQGYVSGSDTITGTLDAARNVWLQFYTVDPAVFVEKYNRSEAVVHKGHTYWYFSTATDWWTADIVARYLGGHLVTISNAEENRFVYELAGRSSTWLGATDRDSEGTWKWVTGEIFNYTNWYSGEPNNAGGSIEGTQNYAVMWTKEDGTWDDDAGSVVQPFVVEFDRILAGWEHDCPSTHLKDIDQNAWYHEYVDYVIKKGLMGGISVNRFGPNVETSRAMTVTILYNLEGRPTVRGANPFTDVPRSHWYADAVIWANSNGIVTGYGNGRFGPDDSITREQFAAILYGYAKFKGYNTRKSTSLSAYRDASVISSWALDAIKWAKAEGLITGRTETTLVPKGNTSRAEAATILKQFIENAI